jgi:integrase
MPNEQRLQHCPRLLVVEAVFCGGVDHLPRVLAGFGGAPEQRAGCPGFAFTTYATPPPRCCWRRGYTPKVVQEILGHSTVSMTLDTYSHTTPAMHREAVATLDRVLEQDQAGQRTTKTP